MKELVPHPASLLFLAVQVPDEFENILPTKAVGHHGHLVEMYPLATNSQKHAQCQFTNGNKRDNKTRSEGHLMHALAVVSFPFLFDPLFTAIVHWILAVCHGESLGDSHVQRGLHRCLRIGKNKVNLSGVPREQ